MVDNSWIKRDGSKPAADKHASMMTIKVVITVIILLSGTIVAIAVHSVGGNASMYQAEGILIDAGEHRTFWTNISYSESSDDPLELLENACTLNSYMAVIEDGKPVSITIDGTVYANTLERKWDLWYVEKGAYDYQKSESLTISASDYTIVTWAYMTSTETPSVAVDATATCIYGYSRPATTVTLSPVCTELVGSMKATSTIIGTDNSSNYPTAVATGKANKTIAVVGTYTDPSYEAIMSTGADMVICDGSQLSHTEMASSLRNSNKTALVVYNGNDFDSLLKNVFIVGAAMGYEQRAKDVIDELELAYNTLVAMTSSYTGKNTMVTLGSNPSPYVAASQTYIDDIIMSMDGTNVFSYLTGWPQVISEYIQSKNPSCIVVLDEGRYTVDEYDLFLSTLSQEWKNTTAYSNGDVYIFCGKLGEMSQRYGPRMIQLAELLARIITPEAFTDGIVLPKAIGDNYQDYLTVTKDLGYDL